MNRPGAVPQSLRGIPAGFGGQQPPQQSARAVSNRIPNGGKIAASNGSGWAFGTGVPLSGGLQNTNRQLGGNLSFAQSLSGSQPATPLDLSEFPSLSNNSQLPNASQSSMWSSSGSRNLGGPPIGRNQGAPLSSTQNQENDLFSGSRLTSNQGSFRFGNQGNIGQSARPQPSSIDDFPPLNQSANGEIGQERGSGLMSSLGFGPPSATASSSQVARAGNGLLNALSANTRATEARSPVDVRSSATDSDARQKQPAFREDGVLSSQSPLTDGMPPSAVEARNPLGAIGNDGSTGKAKEDEDDHGPPVQDPLAGMAPIDRWGIKGLRTLMNNCQDYNALIYGMDPAALGLDLNANKLFSTQVYSLFDDVPPRPAIPKFRLPECYKVTNVGPIENKISSFNEETLMWIFYSCPNDIKQHLAAVELHNRNWRWHKKLQIWLTKDDLMMPTVVGPTHERGYYIIWDTTQWQKVRQEFTLYYNDLDPNPSTGA